MTKTVIFEKKYGVDIEDFSTTTDVEKFIENITSKKLQVANPEDHSIASSRGSVFKMRTYDIDNRFDETIRL
ncbi:MAG: hypothetical protein U9N09_08025 [Euryarchaeota archaeon]|nr:hypothetical protein [Euryarchaeota archaeon]